VAQVHVPRTPQMTLIQPGPLGHPTSSSSQTTDYVPHRPTSSLVLSTSTLLPIPSSEHPDLPPSFALVPPLDRTHGAAEERGVFGWGPPSGPEWCKFVVVLKHTSPLGAAFLCGLHPGAKCRFFPVFGEMKVPAYPHQFLFKLCNHPVEGLGYDREILLTLVPRRRQFERRVAVALHVEGQNGRAMFNIHLGHFEYDERSLSPKCACMLTRASPAKDIPRTGDLGGTRVFRVFEIAETRIG
jgi:hypothetical protein